MNLLRLVEKGHQKVRLQVALLVLSLIKNRLQKMKMKLLNQKLKHQNSFLSSTSNKCFVRKKANLNHHLSKIIKTPQLMMVSTLLI
jgi:hypothetical protein